jgi:hypothetical protein
VDSEINDNDLGGVRYVATGMGAAVSTIDFDNTTADDNLGGSGLHMELDDARLLLTGLDS